jgi:hypothetical protein
MAIAATAAAIAVAALAAISAGRSGLIQGAVIGCALPALAETDSPSPPGMPLSPSAPAAPSSPWTVTISARAPAALAIMTASDATPVINVRVKIER